MIWSSGRHPCPWWWCDVIIMHVSSASRKVVQTWSRDAGRPSSSATCGIEALCALVEHDQLSSLPIKPPTPRQHGVCREQATHGIAGLTLRERATFLRLPRSSRSGTLLFPILFNKCHHSVRFVLLNFRGRGPMALLNYCCLSVHFRQRQSHTGRG